MTGSSRFSIPLWILAILAIVYTLYFARSVLIPIALAVLIGFLLAPVVRRLAKLGLPRWIAAIAVMLVIIGTVAGIAFYFSDPATRWMGRLPEAVDELSWHLRAITQTIEDVEKLTQNVASGADSGDKEAVVVNQVSMTELFVSNTADFFGTLLIMLVLIIFLLSSGDLFLRKTVYLLPDFTEKRRIVEIARNIEREISSYLVTITLINTGLGTATALAMLLTGLEDPVIWGVLAGIANFIPYVGPLVTGAAIFLASLLTFDEWGQIILPPLVFIALQALEGNFITPSLVGRKLLLNPVVVFVALLLLGWLWGIPGALIAVPLLVVFRIVSDRFEPLRPVGEYLSSAPPIEKHETEQPDSHSK